MATQLLRPAVFPGCAVAAVLATGSGAHAQDCIWTPRGALPNNASGRLVYHGGLQRVLLVEGMSSTSIVRVWAWNGSGWDQQPSTGLSRRQAFSVAYDSGRDRLVLFGGGIPWTPSYGDTWEWDGASWTRVALTGPSPRLSAGMAYDAARQTTVLFGGHVSYANYTYLGDTWSWDGQAWVQVASTGPSPRIPAGMTYDPGRARTLLTGGAASSPSDLWGWDGAAWVELAAPPPGPRSAWMVFDTARDRAILARSHGWAASQSEVWELEPASGQWTLRVPNYAPLGPAAFDPTIGRALVNLNTGVLEYDGAGTILPQSIVHQPVGGTYIAGATITLSVQAAGNPEPTYRWFKGATPLEDGGRISGSRGPTLSIHSAVPEDSDQYYALVYGPCLTLGTSQVGVMVQTPCPTPGCYPNCDGSFLPPVLNVADFSCFLAKYAAGDSYANCDASYQPPVLNVQDFSCFLTRFMAGCP